MRHIVLSSEQLAVIRGALEPVEVRDEEGRVVCVVEPDWTMEDIEKAKQVIASDGKWYTTKEMLEHLKSVEDQ